MRTQEEILARIKEIKQEDWGGFGREVLVGFLEYENAKEYLVETATAEEWNNARDGQTPKSDIRDYLPFAWEKARGERGISAWCSLTKINEWAWLSGDSKLMEMVDPINYTCYGRNQLVAISEYLDVDLG